MAVEGQVVAAWVQGAAEAAAMVAVAVAEVVRVVEAAVGVVREVPTAMMEARLVQKQGSLEGSLAGG